MATSSASAITSSASPCTESALRCPSAAPRLHLAAALLLGWPAPAAGQGLPPWVDSGRLPLPDDARSVEVTREGEPLFTAPTRQAARRGAAARGARFPLYAAREGPGCRGDWLLVGSQAWLCSEGAVVDGLASPGSGARPAPGSSALPFDYFFVGDEGALGYASLDTAEQTRPSAELQPDYAVAVVSRARREDPGRELGLTTKGLWVPMRDLRPVTVPPLGGVAVRDGVLDTGFVVTEGAVPRGAAGGQKISGRALQRFAQVRILEETTGGTGTDWVRIDENEWLDEKDVRRPVLSPPPPGVGPSERWIDVDRARQILTAYEGPRPVFTALVSTGKGKDMEPSVTPAGVHRVWVKLRTSDMTNLEDANARRHYAMQEVPWVLFFKEGYGLHGAFWHRSFGQVRSQGCVNLSPTDAAWLFEFAAPRLPAGWTAVLPTEYDPGTVVRVR